MSLLSDNDINRALTAGWVDLDPFKPSHVGPSSYDVTLSRVFRVPNPDITRIDLADVPEDHTQRLELPEGVSLTLRPGEFVLGSTVERVRLGNGTAARYEGRSSLGRLALASHITAGFIDPGWNGTITLEIANHGPWELALHPGMRIGQLCFFSCRTSARQTYGKVGHYQGQDGPVESRFRL